MNISTFKKTIFQKDYLVGLFIFCLSIILIMSLVISNEIGIVMKIISITLLWFIGLIGFNKLTNA